MHDQLPFEDERDFESARRGLIATRSDPVMGAQAQLVAEEDVARLAKYFSSLEGLETTKPE